MSILGAWSKAAVPLLLVVMPAPSDAQILTVTIAPGLYAPTRNTIEEIGGDGFRTQSTVVYLGLRAGVSLGGGFAVEGSVGYAPSDDTIGGQDIIGESTFDGRLILLSLRGTVDLVHVGRAASLFAGAGLGIVARHEDSEGLPNSFENLTDFGGVVGVGLRIGLNRTVALRADLEDYIYKVDLPDKDPRVNELTQHDLVLSAGLAITVLD